MHINLGSVVRVHRQQRDHLVLQERLAPHRLLAQVPHRRLHKETHAVAVVPLVARHAQVRLLHEHAVAQAATGASFLPIRAIRRWRSTSSSEKSAGVDDGVAMGIIFITGPGPVGQSAYLNIRFLQNI